MQKLQVGDFSSRVLGLEHCFRLLLPTAMHAVKRSVCLSGASCTCKLAAQQAPCHFGPPHSLQTCRTAFGDWLLLHLH